MLYFMFYDDIAYRIIYIYILTHAYVHFVHILELYTVNLIIQCIQGFHLYLVCHHLTMIHCYIPVSCILKRSLLPECEGSEVFTWEQEQLRDEDWCEDPACRYVVKKPNFTLLQ